MKSFQQIFCPIQADADESDDEIDEFAVEDDDEIEVFETGDGFYGDSNENIGETKDKDGGSAGGGGYKSKKTFINIDEQRGTPNSHPPSPNEDGYITPDFGDETPRRGSCVFTADEKNIQNVGEIEGPGAYEVFEGLPLVRPIIEDNTNNFDSI